MRTTDKQKLSNEAEVCRQRAMAYVGLPEGTFLLRAAREFDRLAKETENSREKLCG